MTATERAALAAWDRAVSAFVYLFLEGEERNEYRRDHYAFSEDCQRDAFERSGLVDPSGPYSVAYGH